MSKSPPQGRVLRCETCTLAIEEPTWSLPRTQADAIDAHWKQCKEQNPGYFNGTVFIMTGLEGADTGAFRARVQATEFKTYLYWRSNPSVDPTIRDVFGSAIVRSREGHILLGRQSEGNMNAGLSYFPGGLIDPRDATASNAIDIAYSTAREAAEETGLTEVHMTRSAGYIVTFHEPLVSVGVEFQSNEPASQLQAHITAHIQSEENPELTDVVFAANQTDLDQLALAPYAEVLLRELLSETTTT